MKITKFSHELQGFHAEPRRVVLKRPTEVYLTGSFNNWQLIPMTSASSAFVIILELPIGVHHYKFVVDGQWTCDPTQPREGLGNPPSHLNKPREGADPSHPTTSPLPDQETGSLWTLGKALFRHIGSKAHASSETSTNMAHGRKGHKTISFMIGLILKQPIRLLE